MPELRRLTLLFSQAQAADSLYYIESGLVKITRASKSGGRVILAVRGAGDVVGEEALAGDSSAYNTDAEILSAASIVRLPRTLLSTIMRENPELYLGFVQQLVNAQLALSEKIELLCLHDVEFRVLHYLGRLCRVVRPTADSGVYQIPMTQLELADLIGATRETTSTVLNQLERRGLVQLSRRMLTVSSLPAISSALDQVHDELSRPHASEAVDSHA